MFHIFNEKDISRLMKKDAHVVQFDMTKLESEYDYDTDAAQVERSKIYLLRDLLEAIDYCVKQEP